MINKTNFLLCFVLSSFQILCLGLHAHAQSARRLPPANQVTAPSTQIRPLTGAELVALVRQLPARPDLRESVEAEIRRRGIGFPLTSGMRSVVATKSGNDSALLRTLEEAERRRTNPTVNYTPPPAAEAAALIERARQIALDGAKQMPDFIVTQQVTRSYAHGMTKNWKPNDRLTVAVTFRERVGEQYKVLAINGLPVPVESTERDSYEQNRGTSSTGEFVSRLVNIFTPESKTTFQPLDTDTLPQGRAIVYEYEIKLENARGQIKSGDSERGTAQTITVGSRGKLWIDRESARVWRIENTATDIPAEFPVRAAFSRIEYDWTKIDDRPYLMPTRAEVELTSETGERMLQTRNDIRFRNYRKFGAKGRGLRRRRHGRAARRNPSTIKSRRSIFSRRFPRQREHG
jgi:hypothetical protein